MQGGWVHGRVPILSKQHSTFGAATPLPPSLHRALQQQQQQQPGTLPNPVQCNRYAACMHSGQAMRTRTHAKSHTMRATWHHKIHMHTCHPSCRIRAPTQRLNPNNPPSPPTPHTTPTPAHPTPPALPQSPRPVTPTLPPTSRCSSRLADWRCASCSGRAMRSRNSWGGQEEQEQACGGRGGQEASPVVECRFIIRFCWLWWS